MAASRSRAKTKVTKSWSWNGVRHSKASAEALGKLIDSFGVRNGKAWSPKRIVDAARPSGSPIHKLFEWRDSVAAEAYRLDQARLLVRCLVVTIDNGKHATMRATVNFGDGYRSTDQVMESAELRQRLLNIALDEANRWRARYQHLSELASVFSAIEKATTKNAPETQAPARAG